MHAFSNYFVMRKCQVRISLIDFCTAHGNLCTKVNVSKIQAAARYVSTNTKTSLVLMHNYVISFVNNLSHGMLALVSNSS